ncbi:MAG: type II secretion system protein GspG [Phycisphaerales bacterium]|nr:type II secretion system protein GspG [Phycisphaerales bacterium]
MTLRNRVAATCIGALGWFACLAAPAAAQDAAWSGSGPYLRVVDVDDTHMRLDIAVRLFAPAQGEGPTVALAGAMHIAEPTFYALLQQFLDAQDLVLFEGVKPRGTGGMEAADDPTRVRRTESAIRFIAIMAARQHKAAGAYPASIDDLVKALEAEGGEQATWVRSSMNDAWGRPLLYSAGDDAIELRSLGADGREGGTGFDADLALSDQTPLTAAETGDDPGLQSRMAQALGLAFQLDALHHDGPTYRNSDLTIDQVQERVAAAGGDASFLFKILDGSSFAGMAARVVVGIIEKVPTMKAMMKVMLVETMRATDIENLADGKGLPPGMAEMMRVIVVDRNKVVIEDLKGVLAAEDVPQSIGIVYGAGHMGDMEKRLVAECGYRHVGGFWLPAITADLAEAGMGRADLERTRKMLEMMQGGGR